jgi:hypothetical protein
MSPYVVLTILTVAVWISIGVVLSIVMGRRGHISMRWAALGATLGPLAVVAALWTSRHEEDEQPLLFAPAMPLGGRVDVLVGIDGSVECGAALEKAVALLGPRLGRLCLATVVPFDDVPVHTRRAVAELMGVHR